MNARYTRWIHNGINNLILIFLIAGFLPQTLTAQNCDRQRDSLALVALYNATDGPNWTNTWNLLQPIDEWWGVKQNTQGCVDTLDLSSNNMKGVLPSNLGYLINLKRLILSFNNISGIIPESIGNLILLEELAIGHNQLSGSIPSAVGALLELKTLSLNKNELSGKIPEEIGNLKKLKSLFIQQNNLSGFLTSKIWELAQLDNLNLSNNNTDPEELISF